MVKTLAELTTLLKGTDLPVAFDHFNTETKFPFILYIVTNETNEVADGTIYASIYHIQIELYTLNKDFEQEKKLESLLLENGFIYDKNEGKVDTLNDKFYLCTYQITMLKGE